mmetsp:Transcript_27619/g.64032  ORF Transcript_27619/g.64032 Transcript_27619/m.64032 type:complete len:219 (+) Transcript_27619:731-1387(+)
MMSGSNETEAMPPPPNHAPQSPLRQQPQQPITSRTTTTRILPPSPSHNNRPILPGSPGPRRVPGSPVPNSSSYPHHHNMSPLPPFPPAPSPVHNHHHHVRKMSHPDEYDDNDDDDLPPEPSAQQKAMEEASTAERLRARELERQEADLTADQLRAVLKQERRRTAKLAADLAALKITAVQLQAQAEDWLGVDATFRVKSISHQSCFPQNHGSNGNANG